MDEGLVDTVTIPTADDGGGDPPPATFGRFVSLGVLGRGASGVVLRARDPDLDRDVALKLLAPATWRRTQSSLGPVRLQREALAMAKLSHPNVVAVYEMGAVGDARFIAMELVEGTTLRAWLRDKRDWREIVRAFIQCARGLEAAHAAGMVHRDFKPENVLIGADVRPRVADFGLVASVVTIGDQDVETVTDPRTDSELPNRHAVVGTPAYMSPEQWLGDEVDSRSDQFSFCVALWEGLFGARPFIARNIRELRDAVLAGDVCPPGGGRAVRAVVPILRRGLARDRAQRWPSMAQLVRALEAAIARRNASTWIAGGALVAVVATLVVLATRSGTRSPCQPPTDELSGVWDEWTRMRVSTAVLAGGGPDSADRVRTAIDAYTASWVRGRTTQCESTDSLALKDKTAICLDRGLHALAAVTQTLAVADRSMIGRADAAIARLPDLDACGDRERMDTVVPLPNDPDLRRRIADLGQRIAQVDELRLRGQHSEAVASTKAIVADARTIGYAPSTASALNLLGQLHAEGNDEVAAEAAYREAASAAADGHDDAMAAEAWSNVLHAASERAENLAAVAALDPVVDAAVRRAGDPPRLRFSYLISSGAIAFRREDFDLAFARFDAAVKTAPNPRDRATALQDRALVLWRRDGAVKAVDAAVEALHACEQAMGKDHLDTARALFTAAQITSSAGHPAEAKPLSERALAIQTRINGADSIPVGEIHSNLGNIESHLHHRDVARVHFQKAIEIAERNKVPDDALAIPLAAVAALDFHTQRLAESAAGYRRALELFARSSGTETLNYLMMSTNLTSTLEAMHRCDEAEPIFAKIRPSVEKRPAYYPQLLLPIGRCARLKDRSAAVAAFDKALALCEKHRCQPLMMAMIRWELGSTLGEDKRDRSRGIALVRDARATVVGIVPDDESIPTMDAWLRAHPP